MIKKRDLISRTIIQNNLGKMVSYTSISYSLWSVCRNLFLMYENLEKKKYDKKAIDDFQKVSLYFEETFRKVKNKDIHSRHKKYTSLRTHCINQLSFKKDILMYSFLINILLSIYSAESSLIAFNLEKK
jgi:hypothetical protein